jgi:membrane associated rhomboid family serine protease
MSPEIWYFFKKHFQRSENGLMQLILLNVLAFVGLLLLKTGLVLAGYEQLYRFFLQNLALPASWGSFLQQPWSALTYFWVQDGFFDVIWHILFLYNFGQLVLYRLRSSNLIWLYILGGIGGSLGFLLVYNLAPGFQGMPMRLMGPSTSLYAVMVAAGTLLPDFYFQVLLLGRVKVKYIIGALLLLSCFELSQHQVSGVANLSGALIGYLYIRFNVVLVGWKNFLMRFYSRMRSNKFLQISYTKTKHNKEITSPQPVKQTENQKIIDQILDKVAESGYESLTKEEKRQLFEAGH